MSVWDFTKYRPYLVEKLGSDGARTGLRKKLAEAIPVHTTFVSQVLKGKADFSLEQGEAINQFLGHTQDEGEYFLLLLMKDRAGSAPLKKRFEKRVSEMREKRMNIKGRLEAKDEISGADREKFYSSHLYGAAHVLSSIPSMNTTEKMAEALGLSREKMRDVLDFLLRLGVVNESAGELSPGAKHVHLGTESPLLLKHHANWRLHAMTRMQFVEPDDLHYSACVSLSKEDAFRVKESLLKNLKSNIDLIGKSAEETAYVYTFDFYPLLERKP